MIAFITSFLTIVFALIAPERAAAFAAPAFMVTVLVLGLPHGTIDPVLLCSKRLSSQWLGISTRLPWIMAYLGIAGLYWAVWRSSPLTGMFSFLLITILHWGTSEYPRSGNSGFRWYALGVSRGCLVIFGVLALRPAESSMVIETVTGEGVTLPVDILRSFLAVVTIGHLLLLYFENRSDPFLLFRRVLDSSLILLLLAFTPALLGVAIYYSFFHAERYYRFFDGESRSLLGKTHLLCILAIVGLWVFFAKFSLFGPGVLAVHFMFLAALTLPHTLMVWHLQRRAIAVSQHTPQLAVS